MKVLYFNYLYDMTYSSVGAAVHVKEFSAAARSLGIDIKSYDMNKFASDGEAGEEQSKSRAWLKRRLSRYLGQLNALLSNFGYFRREWKIVTQEKPDALLVRYNLLNFSAALISRLRGIPLVLEVNAPMALENRKFNRRTLNLPFVLEWTERLNLKLATKVYTVSNALRNYFVEQGIEPSKIEVVPNGVDIEAFSPETAGAEIKKEYGLDESVVVGFVGSFHYWHGVENLEPYVTALCERYPQVRFLFVGDGPMRETLEKRFHELKLGDRVLFAGYVRHTLVPQYVAAMDIVVAPYPAMSFFYFSPLKLFEYMAAGKAVVASRVGQIAEMITDGETGLLYDPDDGQGLLDQSCRLLEDEGLRRRVGDAAHEQISKHHSWVRNATQVAELIRRAIDVKGVTA